MPRPRAPVGEEGAESEATVRRDGKVRGWVLPGGVEKIFVGEVI